MLDRNGYPYLTRQIEEQIKRNAEIQCPYDRCGPQESHAHQWILEYISTESQRYIYNRMQKEGRIMSMGVEDYSTSLSGYPILSKPKNKNKKLLLI